MNRRLAQSWGRTGLACAIGIMGMMLAGCAATNDPVREAVAQKTDAQKVDDTVSQEISAETFTTEGKPTKTIETPWGPREIYDPVQDPEVISAFGATRDRNHETRYELFKRVDGRKKYANSNLEILFSAREIHHLDAMRIGCSNLISYDCGVSRRRSIIQTAESCSLSEMLGRPRNTCDGSRYQGTYGVWVNACSLDKNGKGFYPNIYYQLVSINTADRPNTPRADTLDEQLTKFFNYRCLEWRTELE